MANIDAAFEPQIFELPERQRITDIRHHRETDHPGRTVEITEGILHRRKLRNATLRLKPICAMKWVNIQDLWYKSDNARSRCPRAGR